MKISTFVALATSTALSLISGAEAQAARPIAGFTPVKGAHFGNVVRRMPVQEMANERPDIFNMFILALTGMQTAKAETDPLSYYQISGIHGVPFIPWQESSESFQDTSRGYCTHNSPLFATWHRPYLALFEQRLAKHAEFEASKFTGSEAARWRAAARNVRLPYWDWAASDLQSRQPPQLTASTVTVRRAGPGGVPQTVTIANPLREYRFTDSNLRARYFRNQFASSTATRRQPPSSQLTSSNMAAVDSAMNRDYASRRSQTYGLFTIPTFNEFSNTQRSDTGVPNGWNSIESIHNTVHVNVGGQWGHMTAVPYSAFDPIFWLHHCNVDRLIAMYQAINPGRMMTQQPASGTFNRRVSSGDRDTLTTPLAPFRNETGNYYNSRDFSDVGSIWRFGYAYTEVPVSFRGDTAGLRDFATEAMNNLYAPSSARKRSTESTRREWICHMTFDATECEGSAEFQVYFNKAQKPSNATAYPYPSNATAPAYGSNSTHLSEDKDGHYVGSCASFQDATTKHLMKMDITGAVYLSDALLEAGCPSLDAKDVVPFLKENLKWVVKLGGVEEVPLDKIPSLKVGVSSSEVTYPEDKTKLPVYGEFQTHYDVTENKKCGFTPKDDDLVDSKPAPPVKGGDDEEEPVEEEPTKEEPVEEEPVKEEPVEEEPVYTPAPTKEAAPTTTPCSTQVVDGVTTIHVTSYTTICPAATCGPVTTAFTSVYPTASVPPYAVY